MRLYNLTLKDYETIIDDISSSINFKNSYFTKSFDGIIGDDIKYTLYISCLAYKDDEKITDIVPIWWEFHTYNDAIYDEFMNDFNFNFFKKMLIEHGNNF